MMGYAGLCLTLEKHPLLDFPVLRQHGPDIGTGGHLEIDGEHPIPHAERLSLEVFFSRVRPLSLDFPAAPYDHMQSVLGGMK